MESKFWLCAWTPPRVCLGFDTVHGFERSSGLLLKWWLWGKERERLEESLLSKIEQEKEEEGEEGEGDRWWIERNDDRGQDSRILGERQRGTHRFDE